MKLLNLKNGDKLVTLGFSNGKVYKVKGLLWDETLVAEELGPIENDNMPEMPYPSFPVRVTLCGIKHGVKVELRHAYSRVYVMPNGSAATDELKDAIFSLMQIIKNVAIYSRMAQVIIKPDSYFIDLDSPVDLTNWIQSQTN